MKLIVLIGLVSIEKAQIASELAGLFVKNYTNVTVLDNISRRPIESLPTGVHLLRIDGDLAEGLPAMLDSLEATDAAILAASETLSPDKLWAMLEALYNQFPDIDIRTIALIDERTCDCFPTVWQQLEAHADLTLRAPFDAREVLEIV